MKKNVTNCILAAIVVVGCLMIEQSTFVAVALIGAAVFGWAGGDIKRIGQYEDAKAKSENIDYLLDCVEFGEWEMN